MGPGGSMPPYNGIPFKDLPAGLGHDLGHPERSFAWARSCMGSLIVVPDSIVLGRLSRPSGAQPSNPWTVTGSTPFIVFF